MSNAPMAIKARYADWRPVKGRKVLQIVLEVPLEQQNEILKLLGAPLPDRDLWVAVAVLDESKGQMKGGKLAQSAGIMCNEGAFWKWSGATNADEAADFIRQRCGVTSRSMLDHDEKAARAFRDMKLEYDVWIKDAA